jgi:hypothetical protein
VGFGTQVPKGSRRRAVDPVIATLLLIALAVGASIVVYLFVTGLIGGLSSGAGTTLVAISGQLSIPGGIGGGLLGITVKNDGNSPISALSVAVPAALGTANGFDTMSYNGAPLILVNNVACGTCVPIGQSAGGAVSTTAGAAGTTYTMTVTVEFQNGATVISTVDITAQP